MHIRDSRGSVFLLGGGVGQKKKNSGEAGAASKILWATVKLRAFLGLGWGGAGQS